MVMQNNKTDSEVKKDENISQLELKADLIPFCITY